MLPAIRSEIRRLLQEFNKPFGEDEVFEWAKRNHNYFSPMVVSWANDNGYINTKQCLEYHQGNDKVKQYGVVALCIVFNADKIGQI